MEAAIRLSPTDDMERSVPPRHPLEESSDDDGGSGVEGHEFFSVQQDESAARGGSLTSEDNLDKGSSAVIDVTNEEVQLVPPISAGIVFFRKKTSLHQKVGKI